MSKTHTVGGTEYYVTCNWQPRDILYWWDLTDSEREWFDYVKTETEREFFRAFRYRGSVYDLGDFERTGPSLRSLGFYGQQVQSVWDAIVLAETDDYETVIVAHVHL